MSKFHTTLPAIKGSEMTMKNNSNEKTNDLIYVQKINEDKYVAHKQMITTEFQAPDLGQAHTYRM